MGLNSVMTRAATILGAGALALAVAAPAAGAADHGYGIGGNPVDCSNNWAVGGAVPVKAGDGRVVGYSQMWWSNSCQGNWTRAWTASGQAAVMESVIFQNRPPAPDRKFAIANDYANVHFTLYIGAGATERMCGSSKIWDTHTQNWAFTGVYCRA